MHKPLPDPVYLRTLINYNPDTGVFHWLNRLKNKQAGTVDEKGYVRIKIDKCPYKASRIAWLFITGNDPGDYQIDHIDGDKGNNSKSNLRLATNLENSHNTRKNKNNTSGYKGVTWYARYSKWMASVVFKGKRHNVGYFDTPETAAQALKLKRETLHKEFTNHD